MKALVFDSGPIITFALNNLLWVMDPLKQRFNGEFYIPYAVKKELIDKPLKTKRYKFEAIQVMKHISSGVLKIYEKKDIRKTTNNILNLTNRSLKAKGNYVKIVHRGEIEAIALANHLNAPALVTDERTTRYLIEKPHQLAKYMRRKLHTKVHVDHDKIKQLQVYWKNIKVLRSVELLTIAYETGLLDLYISRFQEKIMKNPKRTLLESVLWGAKLNGCAVSSDEIKTILKIQSSKK